MRRRLIPVVRFLMRFTVVVVPAIAILAALWSYSPAPGVNFANIQQVKNGMTRQQIEAIVGVPPGNYCVRLGLVDYTEFEVTGRKIGVRTSRWTSNSAGLYVTFDERTGRALSVRCQQLDDPRWDEIRHWLASK